MRSKLEKRFSKLYGRKVAMNDIAIDLVILDFSDKKCIMGVNKRKRRSD